MGLLRKKHDITDIYGIKKEKSVARLPEGRSRNSYSRAYHNHFRGYTEVMRKNEKGRMVIERYYTKPWIVSTLPQSKYLLLRVVYTLLTVLSIVLSLTAMGRRVPGNLHWVVALPGMPSVILMFLLAVCVVQYLFVPRKMTLWDHFSSTKRLKQASVATAIAQGLYVLAMTGFALITGEKVAASLGCAALNGVAACCSIALFLLERKVPYSEVPNDTKLPEGEAHEIR